MYGLGDLAVGRDLLLSIKRLPLPLRNLRQSHFYGAILHCGDAESALLLTTVIDHLSLIKGRITAPIMPLPLGQLLFTLLDELQRPRPRRHVARAKFVMHTNLIHITEQW